MKAHSSQKASFFAVFLLSAGCALIDDMAPRKAEVNGLIATPATYYSTAKARYLGAKYKDNLDRLVERITRNPKTAPLQFANNISSVGGIGFFTHSATKSPDERYLEVVLAAPETFELKGEFSEKVQTLFARYGVELLTIVSSDNEVYQDREMSGYGLNLAWRKRVSQPSGDRVALERAIVYFAKERVRHILRQGLDPNELLADAVIFSVQEDGPVTLVSYRPQESRSDVRTAIKEDNLASASAVPHSAAADGPTAAVQSTQTLRPELSAPQAKHESNPAAEVIEQTEVAKLPAPTPLPFSKQVERASAAQSSVNPLPPLAPPPPVAEETPTREVQNDPLDSAAALTSQSAPTTQPIAPPVRPALKALEGYIIQVAFNDRDKAKGWAESMAKRGFAVSLTEAGSEGSLRLRVGNFPGREEAERQLRLFKQDGLAGIVINLPHAYRPVARTSLP